MMGTASSPSTLLVRMAPASGRAIARWSRGCRRPSMNSNSADEVQNARGRSSMQPRAPFTKIGLMTRSATAERAVRRSTSRWPIRKVSSNVATAMSSDGSRAAKSPSPRRRNETASSQKCSGGF